MIEESEALERILKSTPLPVERIVPVSESVGCFMLRDARAKINLPQVCQSAVDGYAIKASDCEEGSEKLRVVGESIAGGMCDEAIDSGESFRVFTGSQIPMGSNAVVMQEDVEVLTNGLISINAEVSPYDYVRRVGEVMLKDQKILNQGSRVKASALGALIAGGISEVSVGSFPSIGIITTGDELISFDQKQIKLHQSYDSNGLMLKAAASKIGLEKIDIARTKDDMSEISKEFREMKKWADIILVVGGISVGDRDYVKEALTKSGVNEIFWRVRIKPGKPIYYGSYGENGQVFGLPGNSVSAFVCFHLFVLPAILMRAGASEKSVILSTLKASLNSDLHNKTDRPHYVCGKVKEGKFNPIGNQRSNNLLALSQSDSLLKVNPKSSIEAGEIIDLYQLLA